MGSTGESAAKLGRFAACKAAVLGVTTVPSIPETVVEATLIKSRLFIFGCRNGYLFYVLLKCVRIALTKNRQKKSTRSLLKGWINRGIGRGGCAQSATEIHEVAVGYLCSEPD